MPVAGWYPDPGQPVTWRYWDGVHWTDHVAPMLVRAPRDPYSFGAWFEETTALVKATLRRVGVVVLIAHLVAYAAVTAIAAAMLSRRTGDRLEALVDQLESMFEQADDITDAQWERAGDLFGDVIGSIVLIVSMAVLIVGIVTLWTTALAARAAWEAVDDQEGDGRRSVVHPPSLAASATARFPVMLASALVLGAIGIASLTVPLVPLLVAIAADSGTAAIGITGTLGIVAVVVLTCWVAGRLSLSLALAARGGHGLGIASSWRLTEGHYWPVVGRLLIAGLFASVVALPFGFTNGATFLFGTWVGVAVFLTGQALTSAASVLLVAPAQVMTIEHLEAQRAANPTSPIHAG